MEIRKNGGRSSSITFMTSWKKTCLSRLGPPLNLMTLSSRDGPNAGWYAQTCHIGIKYGIFMLFRKYQYVNVHIYIYIYIYIYNMVIHAYYQEYLHFLIHPFCLNPSMELMTIQHWCPASGLGQPNRNWATLAGATLQARGGGRSGLVSLGPYSCCHVMVGLYGIYIHIHTYIIWIYIYTISSDIYIYIHVYIYIYTCNIYIYTHINQLNPNICNLPGYLRLAVIMLWWSGVPLEFRLPCLPPPNHHHSYGWYIYYVYHHQSWQVSGIGFPALLYQRHPMIGYDMLWQLFHLSKGRPYTAPTRSSKLAFEDCIGVGCSNSTKVWLPSVPSGHFRCGMLQHFELVDPL